MFCRWADEHCQIHAIIAPGSGVEHQPGATTFTGFTGLLSPGSDNCHALPSALHRMNSSRRCQSWVAMIDNINEAPETLPLAMRNMAITAGDPGGFLAYKAVRMTLPTSYLLSSNFFTARPSCSR